MRQANTSSFCARLRAHQDGLCALCAKPLPDHLMTVDHVWPKSHPKGRANKRNHVAAHYACNHLKGPRPPTGCELIWLDAVNTKRGPPEDEPQPHRRRPAHHVREPVLGDLWPQSA